MSDFVPRETCESEKLCLHCQQAPCKREGGVLCHTLYMRKWRAEKQAEFERLREQERSQRMRQMAERAERSRRPT